MRVRQLLVFAQCGAGLEDRAVRWVKSAAELALFMDAVRGRLTLGAPAEAVPEVDFDRERVLLVAMGQKPSTGYAVGLASTELDVAGVTATVRVHWGEPEPGRLLAQVLTCPAALLVLPKGSYEVVRVVDQMGAERFGEPLLVPRETANP